MKFLRIDWLTNFLISAASKGNIYIEREAMMKLFEDYGMKVEGTGQPERKEVKNE